MYVSACCYCEGNQFAPFARNAKHPLVKELGPFDLFTCLQCGTLTTFPLPSREALSQLYTSFEDGLQPRVARLRNSFPLTSWYRQCIAEIKRLKPSPLNNPSLNWLDLGSGREGFAKEMVHQFPQSRGVQVDLIHEEFSSPALQSRNIDLNEKGWEKHFGDQKFDLVVSLASLEHMIDPHNFLVSALSLLEKNGALYIVAPDFGSLAAKVLRKRWPYYLPGEHIHIPTMRGLSKWFQRVQQTSSNAYRAKVRATRIPYPAPYLLKFVGLKTMAGWFSADNSWSLPTGLLELVIIRRK